MIDSGLPKRKRNRLNGYDYSTNGMYFVTICTHNRRNLLCDIIVGEAHEPPAVVMSDYGIIVDNVINNLQQRFNIEISNYIIMPNHIHLLISIDDFRFFRATRESPLHSKPNISQIVGYLKMNVSKEIHKSNPDLTVWQRSFHDHIIRDDEDCKKIYNYIESNPSKWTEDCFYIE